MNVIQSKTKYSKLPIMFKDVKHHLFYKDCLQKTGREGDVYQETLFYLLGLTEDTRKHITEIYDYNKAEIKVDGLTGGWQTEATLRICRLAFNLFDGYTGKETKVTEYDYMPCDLFRCELMRYMLEAIKIRFPEYCIHTNTEKKG